MSNPLGLESLTSREEIGKYLLSFCELHRRQLTPALLSLFCEALADLTPNEVQLGFQEVARRVKFFPAPAEIREALEVALERMPRRSLALHGLPSLRGLWMADRRERRPSYGDPVLVHGESGDGVDE